MHMRDSEAAALAAAAGEKLGSLAKVPTFDHVWLAGQGDSGHWAIALDGPELGSGPRPGLAATGARKPS